MEVSCKAGRAALNLHMGHRESCWGQQDDRQFQAWQLAVLQTVSRKAKHACPVLVEQSTTQGSRFSWCSRETTKAGTHSLVQPNNNPPTFTCETSGLYIKWEIHIPLPIWSAKLPNIFTYRKTLATELCYKNNRTSWGFHLVIPCGLALINGTSSEKIYFLSGEKTSSSKKVTFSVSHVYVFAQRSII